MSLRRRSLFGQLLPWLLTAPMVAAGVGVPIRSMSRANAQEALGRMDATILAAQEKMVRPPVMRAWRITYARVQPSDPIFRVNPEMQKLVRRRNELLDVLGRQA